MPQCGIWTPQHADMISYRTSAVGQERKPKINMQFALQTSASMDKIFLQIRQKLSSERILNALVSVAYALFVLLGATSLVHADDDQLIIVEASRGLPVAIPFILALTPNAVIPDRLRRMTAIESREVLQNKNSSGHDTIITSIPGLSGNGWVDYVIRRGKDCDVVLMKADGNLDRLSSFKCSIENISLVRERAECAASGGTWDIGGSYKNDTVCLPGNKQSCADRGGKFHRVCISQVPMCVLPYSDTGKDCTDGSQCEGERCISAGRKPDENGVIYGKCQQDNNPCGSFDLIKHGKRGLSIHYD